METDNLDAVSHVPTTRMALIIGHPYQSEQYEMTIFIRLQLSQVNEQRFPARQIGSAGGINRRCPMTIIRRNRAKQELALKVRLIKAARISRDAAHAACTETERLELLKRARRYEVTAGFDEWLSSPGLRPPE